MFNHRFVVPMVCVLPTWIVICGCGGSSQQYTSGEEAAVQEFISSFSDARKTPESLAVLFVEGSVPDAATLKLFEPYMPSASSVSISGNLATVDVEFEELATGKIIGPAVWTLEKTEDNWRIKTCPLPQVK